MHAENFVSVLRARTGPIKHAPTFSSNLGMQVFSYSRRAGGQSVGCLKIHFPDIYRPCFYIHMLNLPVLLLLFCITAPGVQYIRNFENKSYVLNKNRKSIVHGIKSRMASKASRISEMDLLLDKTIKLLPQ